MSSPSAWLLVLALGGCSLPGPLSAPPKPPRILVVNDDGIDAPGIAALALELSHIGEVVVCAPDGNRSGSSHSSVAFSKTLTVLDHKIKGASYACSISGMPSDATSYGLLRLGAEKPFDLVVSGVNRGANVGLVAHYSGTIGAAMEGNYHGIPSVAVSQDSSDPDFGFAARWAAKFVDSLWQQGPPPGICWSINVPSTLAPIRGVRAARMGGSYLRIHDWSTTSGDRVRASFSPSHQAAEDTDTAAWQEGWITVTPLRFDWTDTEALSSLPSWMPGLFSPPAGRR